MDANTHTQHRLCVWTKRLLISWSVTSIQNSASILTASPSSRAAFHPSIIPLTFSALLPAFISLLVAVVTQQLDNFSFLIADCCNFFKWFSPRYKCPFFPPFFVFPLHCNSYVCLFFIPHLTLNVTQLLQESSPRLMSLYAQGHLVKSKMAQREGSTQVREGNGKKKKWENGESSDVPVIIKSVGVCLNAMLHAHQEIGLERVAHV